MACVHLNGTQSTGEEVILEDRDKKNETFITLDAERYGYSLRGQVGDSNVKQSHVPQQNVLFADIQICAQ